LSPEQGFELNGKLLSKVRVIYKAIFVVDVLKWILMILGASLLIGSIWLIMKQNDIPSLDLVPGIPRTVREVTPLANQSRY
jgi:hypothetical protein